MHDTTIWRKAVVIAIVLARFSSNLFGGSRAAIVSRLVALFRFGEARPKQFRCIPNLDHHRFIHFFSVSEKRVENLIESPRSNIMRFTRAGVSDIGSIL
jgi:hypothetical protein